MEQIPVNHHSVVEELCYGETALTNNFICSLPGFSELTRAQPEPICIICTGQYEYIGRAGRGVANEDQFLTEIHLEQELNAKSK